MGKNTLSFSKRVEVYERLKTICKKDGGYAVYAPGWNDARVARLLGCSDSNIRSIREEMFGPLHRGSTSDEVIVEILARLDGLEAAVSKLDGRIVGLELAITRGGNNAS